MFPMSLLLSCLVIHAGQARAFLYAPRQPYCLLCFPSVSYVLDRIMLRKCLNSVASECVVRFLFRHGHRFAQKGPRALPSLSTGSDGFGTCSTEIGIGTRKRDVVRMTGGGEQSTIGKVHVNVRFGRLDRQPLSGKAEVVVVRVPIIGAS